MEVDLSDCNISEDCQDEILSLLAIYGDDLRIEVSDTLVSLEMDIVPYESEVKMTDQDMRVCFCLGIRVYLDRSLIDVRKCKGLTNYRILEIESLLNRKISEESIFEVIVAARDTLSEMNMRPDGDCSICLSSFGEIKSLYKLNCYHLYHNRCIFRYLYEALIEIRRQNTKLPDTHKLPELLYCPVCRHELNISFDEILRFKSFQYDHEKEMEISDYFSQLAIDRQKRFQINFNKQKSKGSHWTEETNCIIVRHGEQPSDLPEESSNIDLQVHQAHPAPSSNTNKNRSRNNYRYRYKKRREHIQHSS